MRKKYFVILAVVMILATAIFMHLQTKEKQDLKSHHEQEYMRIIEAARKSPHAGLAQMGQALNRYYEKTKSYPPELEALYPDYIPVHAFITDIEWGYRKQGDNFYLSKSLAMGNQTMVAAIDKSLSPLDTKDSQLASNATANRPQKTSPLNSSGNAVPDNLARSQSKSPIDSAADRTGANLQNLTARLALGSSAARIENSSPAVKKSPVAGPEVIAVQEVKEKEKSLCEKEGGYLVWRSKDGSIGFSNVQYPQQDQITIYDSGMWSIPSRIKSRFTIVECGSRLSIAMPGQQQKAKACYRLTNLQMTQSILRRPAAKAICCGRIRRATSALAMFNTLKGNTWPRSGKTDPGLPITNDLPENSYG